VTANSDSLSWRWKRTRGELSGTVSNLGVTPSGKARKLVIFDAARAEDRPVASNLDCICNFVAANQIRMGPFLNRCLNRYT
jgi:hypothetical protein